jgi:hypothetical protein
LLAEYVLGAPIKDIIAPVSASCQKQPRFHLLSSQHESKSHIFAPVIIPTLFHKLFFESKGKLRLIVVDCFASPFFFNICIKSVCGTQT